MAKTVFVKDHQSGVVGAFETISGGTYSYVIAGDSGFALSGKFGTSIVGRNGKASTGDYGYAVGGLGSSVQGGFGAKLTLTWHNEKRNVDETVSITINGWSGLIARTWYRLNSIGEFTCVGDLLDVV